MSLGRTLWSVAVAPDLKTKVLLSWLTWAGVLEVQCLREILLFVAEAAVPGSSVLSLWLLTHGCGSK